MPLLGSHGPLGRVPPFSGPFALPAKFEYEPMFQNRGVIALLAGVILMPVAAFGYVHVSNVAVGAIVLGFWALVAGVIILGLRARADVVVSEFGIERAFHQRRWGVVPWSAIESVTIVPVRNFSEDDAPYLQRSINPLKRMAVEARGVPMCFYVFRYRNRDRIRKFRIDDRIIGADNMKVLLNHFLKQNGIRIKAAAGFRSVPVMEL